MASLPWAWIFWGVVVVVAIRLLLNHVYALRDHLSNLLMEHLKVQIEEAKKRQNILRMQAKIRERNERAEAERLSRERKFSAEDEKANTRRAA